ncbi:MAG: hypothetical protein EZS28_050628, partial [Streblomastix strix]
MTYYLLILFTLFGCVSSNIEDISCTVNWINEDGISLYSARYKKESYPEYLGSIPVKSDDLENNWIFINWNPIVTSVTRDVTYTATYLDSLNYSCSPNPFSYLENSDNIVITGLSIEFQYLLDLEIEVPTLINQKKVVSIGRNAFFGCNNITNIILPPTIKTIEAGAFARMEKLERLVLPNSLEYVEYGWDDCLTTVIYLEKEEIIFKEPANYNDLTINHYEWIKVNNLSPDNNDFLGNNYVPLFQWQYNENLCPEPLNYEDLFELDEIWGLSINNKYRYITGEIVIPYNYRGIKVSSLLDFNNTRFSTVKISEGINHLASFYDLRVR